MLRRTPSYWARLSEKLLLDEPLSATCDIGPWVHARRQQAPDAALSELLELMVAHLSTLPNLEAAGRVALTLRFLRTGLAR